MQINPPPRRRVSFWARLLAVIFLALAVTGWLRLWQALALWELLSGLGAWPGPFYLALSGALWGLAGLPAAAGLWLGRRWGLLWAAGAGLFYPLTYWIDRVWIAQRSEGFPNWPFALGVTVAWLAFFGLALLRFRKTWV